MLNTGRFSIFCLSLQVLFIILFAVFVRYSDDAMPPGQHDEHVEEHQDAGTAGGSAAQVSTEHPHGKEKGAREKVAEFYPFFQDVHVMIFIGFGFLMTFLKRYGFSAVGLNLLIAALVIQWATLVGGWLMHFHHNTIHINMESLILAEFAAATVLISYGAVLGKLNALQLLVMAVIEIVLFQVNEYFVFNVCAASDVGDSMVVHAFGAYFGLAVARMVYTDDVHKFAAKEESTYHSDLFAMIGTVFLWIFWPSFNSATAVGEGHYRAIINTYFSLAACAVTAYAISSLLNKNKFNMIHIQNATLAGGVAIGTMADMIIQPWAAMLIGSLAAILSVVGYRFVTPFLSHKLGIHDTCGVNNLHGMPGIISGLGGIICAALASSTLYGDTLLVQFPEMATRSAGKQAAFQAAGLAGSVLIAIVGGILTGLLLKIPIWQQPAGPQVFDDGNYWTVPEDGFPEADDEHKNKHVEQHNMA